MKKLRLMFKLASHLLPELVPIGYMLERGADGLHVPEHEQQQEETAHQTGEAKELLDAHHHALQRVKR
ncbi:MAG: hypothetical protein LKE41_11655 [Prevotella sp.]|nr:hypothetical protein [Prevotella sp.]MCI2080568.1 hypothetical protein [Prevotella sp.]MCI2102409.1 hypothetical protein [Prevotella sp.]